MVFLALLIPVSAGARVMEAPRARPVAASPETARVVLIPTPPPEPATPYGTAPRQLLKWGAYGEGPGQFIYLPDIAVDRRGDVYALDENRCRILKFSSEGRFLFEWGSRGGQPGQLVNPVNLAVDDAGHVYVSDFTQNCIHVFADTGRFLSRWGTTGSGPGELNGPQGVAVGTDGAVYVVDRSNHRVQKFTSKGQFVTQWGRQGSAPGEFLEPVGIAVDRSNDVYVADYEIGGVQKFTSRGEFISSWRTKQQNSKDYTYSSKVAVDAQGHVYLCDNHRNQIEEYSSRGALIRAWTSGGRGVGRFLRPTSVAVDGQGDVYVVGASEGESDIPAFVRKFGFGPTSAEQVLARAFGSMDKVNALLDTLQDVPIGTSWAAWDAARLHGRCEDSEHSPGLASSTDPWIVRCRDGSAIDSIETRGYFLGFGSQPSLESVSWQIGAERDSSANPRAVYEALSDVLSRRLGFPTPVATSAPNENPFRQEAAVFPLPGALLQLSLQFPKGTDTPIGVHLDRLSDGLVAAKTASPDTSDLRLFEGQPYARGTIRRELIRALSRRPGLAQALRLPQTSPEQLHEVENALDRVFKPGTDHEERDLVYLAADTWLAALPLESDSSSFGRIRRSLARFGARFVTEPEYGVIHYCGSLLVDLARQVDSDPWANRAFVLLLDQGWDATCSEQYEGATFSNELFPPVLKHGEAFLRQHPHSGLWPAVALRVALAHETAWSLSFTSTAEDFPDYRVGAAGHLARALELDRALARHIRDPRFARALQRKIELLAAGVDTRCRVYYEEWGD